MDFFEVIEKRHCCREFDSDKNVENDLIEKIIDSGKKAPSAGGIYPIDFLIIKDAKTKEEISKACSPFNQAYINEAPVFIIVIADVDKTSSKYGVRGRELYVAQDSAAAVENMFLSAVALDLGCSWIGAFDEENLIEVLRLEKNIRPMAILPIGYKKK